MSKKILEYFQNCLAHISQQQNKGLNCRRHQGAMLKGMLMIKIIYMCVTRNSCTPTCTPRAQCRRASCLGLGIINRERVFSDYSLIIGSLTAEGTKGRCKMAYQGCTNELKIINTDKNNHQGSPIRHIVRKPDS